MAERFLTYAAQLVTDWYGSRMSVPARLDRASEGEVATYLAMAGDRTLALAVTHLWEADASADTEVARQLMEERLSSGNVRGPHMLWVPPRAAVPSGEPEASDFVMRTQIAAAPLLEGARTEIDLPVKVQLAKVREEGGYASVIGGLSRYWTNITDRVQGTVHVNSAEIRRVSQSESAREALFARIGEISPTLELKEPVECETVESWTLQRLTTEPLGETGFAIVQAPPRIDPADGSLMRRLVRNRLKAASESLHTVDADSKGVALLAIYEYPEHENVGSFVKSIDPAMYSQLDVVCAVVDGEVRPIFTPR